MTTGILWFFYLVARSWFIISLEYVFNVSTQLSLLVLMLALLTLFSTDFAHLNIFTAEMCFSEYSDQPRREFSSYGGRRDSFKLFFKNKNFNHKHPFLISEFIFLSFLSVINALFRLTKLACWRNYFSNRVTLNILSSIVEILYLFVVCIFFFFFSSFVKNQNVFFLTLFFHVYVLKHACQYLFLYFCISWLYSTYTYIWSAYLVHLH